jgi:negative regulator of sigma E activity
MDLEQLEFTITQYLDGTLPPEESAALQVRLANDPEARALLAEHQKLTALLRAEGLPELDWDELASDFSAVVTGTVGERSRADDQRLNTILKSAVAPLPGVRWDALAERISASIDAEVAATDATDAEDEKLDALLRSTPGPVVKWDRLAAHLSGVVAAEAPSTEQPEERPAVAGRIGFGRFVPRMAIAASLLVATGIGALLLKNDNGSQPGVAVNPAPVVVADVTPPRAETATQPALAEISIGPSKAYAAMNDDGDYRRNGVASRSPVVIVSPVRSAEEDQDWSAGTFD